MNIQSTHYTFCKLHIFSPPSQYGVILSNALTLKQFKGVVDKRWRRKSLEADTREGKIIP